MVSLIYGVDTDDLEEILAVHEQGGSILCPKCGSKLLIINSWESVAASGRNPGIHCLTNEEHVQITFLLADRREEIWRRFEQRTRAQGESSDSAQE